MKKTTLLSCVALCFIISIKAQSPQWSPLATNIWNLNTGTVGIGTGSTLLNAGYKLNVEGNTRFQYTSGTTGFIDLLPSAGAIELAANTIGASFIDFRGMSNLAADYRGRILYADGSGFYLYTAGSTTTRLLITETGNVGVNTNAPLSTLHVEGESRTTNGTGSIIISPTAGGIDMLAKTGTTSYVDFKGSGSSALDFKGRLKYIDGSGFHFNTNGTSTTQLFINESGQVGVGTITPTATYTMEVAGSTRVSASSGGYFDVNPAIGQLSLKSQQTFGYLDFKIPGTPLTQFAARILYDATFGLNFFDSFGGNATMAIDDGSVAIGVVSKPAGYKLYVETGILTEKVKVAVKTTADWMDKVFEPNYQLLSLDSVQSYTKENKHLPGMPSADDVVANGIDVAQMDALLLQQIEELWLQLMILKKENEELRNEINSSK